MIAIYLENIDFSEPFDARAPDQQLHRTVVCMFK